MSIFTVPTIETDRLILRPHTVEDAEAVFEWTSDERVAEFMNYNRHESVNDSLEWLKSLDTLENEYTWGIVRKEDGKLIGSCSIRRRPDGIYWSFGYNLRFDCWNQGYATEAAKRMIEFVRKEHNARRITAEHAVDNPASGRVMEKCGMRFVRFGEYSSFDGTRKYRSKVYELNEGEKMIKHIVMFKLKDADGRTEYENAVEAQKRFENVIANVKELKRGEVVINSKEAPDSNYTISLLCDFESIADLNAYQVHPAHVEFGKFIGTVKTDRACIDYEY